MKLKKFLAAGISLLLVFSLSACKQAEPSSSQLLEDDYPVTVGGVTLSSQPKSVIVLSDNIADIILALGYESSLKARGENCTQTELAVLPTVSIDDIDGLKSYSPDLILTDEEPQNIEQLALAGLPVMVLGAAANRSDLEVLYGNIGSALMGAKTGYSASTTRASEVLASIDDLTRKIPSSDIITTACFLYDLDGNVAAGDTFAGIIINACGVTNAFQNSSSGEGALASLKIANPDYIFCAPGLKASILQNTDLSTLKAVKEEKVYEIDSSYMRRQGRSAIQAVSSIIDIIYNGAQPPASDTSSSVPDSSTPPTSSSSSSSSRPFVEMKYGDNNEDVKALQQRLYDLGYITTEPTGEFGDLTEFAVSNFQFVNGYNVTGTVNEPTFNAIYSSDAVPSPD